MTYPPEPSHDDCTANTRGEWQGLPTMAIWYPSMGGYVAHAVAVDTGEGDLDVYVWHDGEFPFSDASPVRLHHCSAADFTRFGREIDTWLSKDAAPPAKVPATYDDAIRALLTVPSHETHVAADWLEARRDGREPEFATTPRSWSLPVIPADVKVVRDAMGYVWRRQPDRWVRQTGAWTTNPIEMVVRFNHLSPLTEVAEEQP